MAWGIARWGEELEFTMSATKKEPHPDGRVRSLERQVTGVSLCSVAIREQSILGLVEGSGRPEITGQSKDNKG